jgi:hypothetical protein
MDTHTGEHPQRDPIPPGWPGDDPTLPEELAALGRRRALPVPPGTRHRRARRADHRPDHGGEHRAPPASSRQAGELDGGGDPDPVDLISDEEDHAGDRTTSDLVEVARTDGAVRATKHDRDHDQHPDHAPDGDDRDDDGNDDHEPHAAHSGELGGELDDDLVAGVQPAGRVLVVMVLALVLTMLVNADALVARAEQKPPGPGRDRSLAVWHAVQDVSHALQLHRIREVAVGVTGGDDDEDREAAATGTSAGAAGTRSADAAGAPDSDPATPPSLAAAPDAAAPDDGAAADDVPRLRTPTADEPLRLWVGGDSMAQVFGPALAERASATGRVDATVHYEMASGLTRPDYYDWPRALATDAEEADPEVVVVVFGVNDAQGIVLRDGTPVPEVGDPRWAPEYRRRVGALMDQLRHDDRLVMWVALPPMREPGYDGRIAVIDEAVAAEAATRPWIVLVDSAPAVAGAGGAYADALPDAGGTPIDVRQGDGIHLTTAGGERLAGQVYDAIAGRVDLGGSADDDGGE